MMKLKKITKGQKNQPESAHVTQPNSQSGL
jgi:hypothetical protein